MGDTYANDRIAAFGVADVSDDRTSCVAALEIALVLDASRHFRVARSWASV